MSNTPNPLADRAMDEALAIDAKLAALADLIARHRSARLKEARETGTLKTSGHRDRLETEYLLLGIVEDVFGIDTDDAREECRNVCLAECGYDVRKGCYPGEEAAERGEYFYNVNRDGQLVAAWERGA